MNYAVTVEQSLVLSFSFWVTDSILVSAACASVTHTTHLTTFIETNKDYEFVVYAESIGETRW